MNAYFKGNPVFGPRGPAGPDGNPIGTVISFMGITAPEDYLFCDGTVHNISDYPDLAAFFAEQFGSMNYFGGDGTTTFAVPDLRNLFLRGFHGNAEESLSGEIGIKQEATRHVWVETDKNGNLAIGRTDAFASGPLGYDELEGIQGYNGYRKDGDDSNGRSTYYTARPVNMAVLYCIKAVPSNPVLEEYDTDDGWHVRKWSDGYVEMILNKTYDVVPSQWKSTNSTNTFFSVAQLFPSYSYPIQLKKILSETPVCFADDWTLFCSLETDVNRLSQTQVGRPCAIGIPTIQMKINYTTTITGQWK